MDKLRTKAENDKVVIVIISEDCEGRVFHETAYVSPDKAIEFSKQLECSIKKALAEQIR